MKYFITAQYKSDTFNYKYPIQFTNDERKWIYIDKIENVSLCSLITALAFIYYINNIKIHTLYDTQYIFKIKVLKDKIKNEYPIKK